MRASRPKLAKKKIGQNENVTPGGTITNISINLLRLHKKQARSKHKDSYIQELAKSIKANGCHTPLIVYQRYVPGSNEEVYEISAGEGRYLAHKLAGLQKVPCIILRDEKEALIASIETNEFREKLHPVDRGRQILELERSRGDDRRSEDETKPEDLEKIYNLKSSSLDEYRRMATNITKVVTGFLIEQDISSIRDLRIVEKIAIWCKENCEEVEADIQTLQLIKDILLNEKLEDVIKGLEPKDVQYVCGLSTEEIREFIVIQQKQKAIEKVDRDIEKAEAKKNVLLDEMDEIDREVTEGKRKSIPLTKRGKYDKRTRTILKVDLRSNDQELIHKIFDEGITKDQAWKLASKCLEKAYLEGMSLEEMKDELDRKWQSGKTQKTEGIQPSQYN
jgi:hypothetical protein